MLDTLERFKLVWMWLLLSSVEKESMIWTSKTKTLTKANGLVRHFVFKVTNNLSMCSQNYNLVISFKRKSINGPLLDFASLSGDVKSSLYFKYCLNEYRFSFREMS